MLHHSDKLATYTLPHTYNIKLQENKFREFARTTMIHKFQLPVRIFVFNIVPSSDASRQVLNVANCVFTRATLARFIPPTTVPIRAPHPGHRAYRKEWGDNGTRPPATRDQSASLDVYLFISRPMSMKA